MSYKPAISEHMNVMGDLQALLDVLLEPAVSMLQSTVVSRGTIYLAGNGGSAAQAAHLAAELMVRFRTDRPPIASVCLNADSTYLTAATNDYEYRYVFSRAIEALGRPGDTLIVLSASGKSPNILAAVNAARAKGITTLGLSGVKGIQNGVDVDLAVSSTSTARIQEAHLLLVHILVEELEKRILQ